ncbi:MAG: hypothetical protein GY764_15885 [Halieaceae bacterium]|nr:hypothetical protein [Halieaceae bacterium]
MNYTRRISLFTLALVMTVLFAGGLVLALSGYAEPASSDPISSALAQARQTGSYHIVADIEQTLIPQAAISTVGRGEEQQSLRILGDVAQRRGPTGADEPYARLQFYAGKDQEPVSLQVKGAEVYVGYQGRWKEVDDPLGGTMPGGDPLAYLTAVENVEELDPVKTAEGTYRRYGYHLDGKVYAEQQRQRMQALLAGRLPSGVELAVNPLHERMSGEGELWVDERGLPRRQVLAINLPEVQEDYDAIVHMQVDYSRYGERAPMAEFNESASEPGTLVEQVSSVETGGGEGEAGQTPSISAEKAGFTMQELTEPLIPALLALPLLLLAISLVRRRRRMYASVVVAMIVMMVLQPLLQVGQFTLFHQARAEASSFEQALQDLGAAPTRMAQRDVAQQAPSELARTGVEATALTDCRVLYVKEGVDPQGDDDGDGLFNEVEWCLGTDYAEVDSDSDGITDTVELQGFTDENGKQWWSDPLLPDSNNDGMGDGEEWSPFLTSDVYTGTDGFTDKDSDGVPNLWDDDNDDDGVPDAQDISPFQVLAYRPSFEVNVSGHATDTVVYVDVAVQPQEQAHLRYTLTSLDWPDDSLGQMQDRDSSSDDITLVPVLELKSTQPPSLAGEYNILSVPINPDDVSQGYDLWVPLQPVTDGGAVYAFGGRIAFSAGEADAGIQLTEGRVLWLANAVLDSCVTDDSEACAVTSEDSMVASYYEDQFRVTGLNVLETKDVQVGLFGATAPAVSADQAVDDELKVIMQLMTAGLAGSYLMFQNPDLTQIEANFADPSAQTPYTDTWGIDPASMVVQVDNFEHRDQALATTTQTNTVALLDRLANEVQGVACSLSSTGFYTPTLGTAYEETMGSVDLSSLLMDVSNGNPAVISGAPVVFSIALGDAVTYVRRQAQMGSYACATDDTGVAGWRALSNNEAMNEMSSRYSTEDGLTASVQLLFAGFYAGMSNIISFNGVLVDGVQESTDSSDFDYLNAVTASTMPEYVRQIYQLDALESSLDTSDFSKALRDWQLSFRSVQQANYAMDAWLAQISIVVATNLIQRYQLSTWLSARNSVVEDLINRAIEEYGISNGFRLQRSGAADWFIDGDRYSQQFNLVNEESGKELDDNIYRGFSDNFEGSLTVEARKSQVFYTKLAAYFVATAITAVFVGIDYAMYRQSAKSLDGIQADAAEAQFFASTIIQVTQLIFSLILIWVFNSSAVGVALEFAIFLIVYIVVGAITGNWSPLKTYNFLITWLGEAILNLKLLAKVPKDGVNAGNINFTLDISNTRTSGPLPDGWYTIATEMTTTLAGKKVGNSWAYVRWDEVEQPFYLQRYNTVNAPELIGSKGSGGIDNCSEVDSEGQRQCYVSAKLQFQPAEAGRNTAIPFINSMEAKLRYKDNFGSGLQYVYSEDESLGLESETAYFYIDILPRSLAELVSWDAYQPVTATSGAESYADFNVDKDSDGLTSSEEDAIGTSDNDWDYDDDGLSDGWEEKNSLRGVNVLLADGDGDGLGDREEILLGTAPDIADTDSDGLLDGEEVCRYDAASGNLVGGWEVSSVGGYWVCSDPKKADYDDDGILDGEEREAGLSPYAPNTAPYLRLLADPAVFYNGNVQTVLAAGAPVTISLRLDNRSAASVNQPLQLVYDASILTNGQVFSQSGSGGYVPPSPTQTDGGLNWDMAAAPLYTGERMSSTLLLEASSGLAGSQLAELVASVQYSDVLSSALAQVTQTVSVLVDGEVPTSQIISPADGEAINGNVYVVGGSATDVTSWPVGVAVKANGDGYDSGWQAATSETNVFATWAWQWTPLPADGLYTLQSRASDYVGNVENPITSTTVIVDNTAPGASFNNLTDGEALTINSNQVTVQGSATDLLSGVADVAGLQLVQLSIDGRPWVNVWQQFNAPHPVTATWSSSWSVSDDAYGSHSLSVRAVDALNQIGDASRIEVIVDTLEPTDMWSNYQPSLPAGQPFELLGHADDEGNVPLPARPHKLENVMDSVISATVMLMPESYTDTQGMTINWLGDVNGDARADLAVGMPQASANSNASAGRVAVVYGSPGGWPIPSDAVALAEATTSFIGNGVNVQLGEVVAPAGDTNGDGLSDLCVGDPANNQAYLVYGQANGLRRDFTLSALSQTSNGSLGKVYTSSLGSVGRWLSSAGDVDGDGFDDLLVGVTGVSGGTGHMYLVQGRSALSRSGVQDVGLLTGPAAVSMEYLQMDNNGAVATGVGDVNGDGYHDFVIADPNDSYSAGQAAVYLFLGPVNWRQAGETGALNPLTHANASFVGDSNVAVGEQVVALGDVNGDQLPDFAYASGNAPRIVYGRSSGWSPSMSADVTFDGYTPAPNNFIAAVGDVNGDGLNDILLGATGGGGRAYLVHGSGDLATNQPVQAQISGVSSAASAPYAAGADLNCDLSSDLLLVPTGDFSLQAQGTQGLMSVRRQSLAFNQQGRWIGPAPRPRAMSELPSASAIKATSPEAFSAASTLGLSNAVTDSLTTSALAFRLYDNNISDWLTDTVITGDWDGDGKSDVAGWTGSGWRSWHADGLSSNEVQFTEYTNNIPAAVTGGAPLLKGDFDGDGLDDLAAWDGSAWQFVRATGASGNSFDFAAISSDLGGLGGGDTGKMIVGDFDGDGRTDVAAWDGSAWVTYISNGTSTALNFANVSNNLGSLVAGDAGSLLSGDFDGDGKSDLASRESDTSNWVVWISAGVSGDALTFQEVTNNSLGYAVDSTVPRVAADFSGDGKSDVLALLDQEFSAWLSQAAPGGDAVPFRVVPANGKQFSGSFPADTLIGDFDGDGKADYASLNELGDGWRFQLASLAAVRYVDDDYCSACANDGHSWGVDAFGTLKSALDAAWFGDTIEVAAGVYNSAVIHAGQDYLTLRGSDADAVFLDAQGGTGITILPPDEVSNTYANIVGVTIQNLTISNALSGIKLNHGGQATADPDVSDGRNIVIKHVLFNQELAGSTAVDAFLSALWLRHNTLVADASDVTLVANDPGGLPDSYVFLQDNLFVALANAAPLPFWWTDSSSQNPALTMSNGFASENGLSSDWQSAPVGVQMTVQDAQFLNVAQDIFRIGAASQAIAQASGGKDLGYYSYRGPVYVDATYCETCDNDGRTWGEDAFSSIQEGIDSGALRVLVDPGLYRERIALVHGVQVFGSGAGLTVLAPPDMSGGYLVGVENARETALALLTIAGEDSADGIQVEGGSEVSLKRLIVHNTGTAVDISGSTARATLINDTLVSNDNGVVAEQCSSVDMRNSILAFQQQMGLNFETSGCPGTQRVLHNFNAYWRNTSDFEIDGVVVDQPGVGEIFADPRFRDVSNHDYRLQVDSPVVDAGDPSDPAPPGSGVRVDLGYAQAAEASVYASKAYCEQCLNDGLEWQVTAFDTIQDAIDNVPDLPGMWTVGVDGGDIGAMVYEENVALKSGIRLVGSGAEQSIIDGADDSVLTLDGVTHVEVIGFTITDGGSEAGDAGIRVTGASNQITITRNIIGGQSPLASTPANGNAGVRFEADSSGSLSFNTIVQNFGAGVQVSGERSWLNARYNIVAQNDIGFDNSAGGQIFNAYNLLGNTNPSWCASCADYKGSVTVGQGERSGDPGFVDGANGDFRLTTSSPALDAIPSYEYTEVATGGGARADMGYRELLAMPATLLLGLQGNSCGLGSAGIASVDVGLVFVNDASQSPEQTLPTSWQSSDLFTSGQAGSYYTTTIKPSDGDGLYRLYTRAADSVGNVSNQARDWYRSSFIADGTRPHVRLVSPGGNSDSSAPAISLQMDVSDWVATGMPGETSYNIRSAFFEVDGAVVTATRSITVASEGGWQRYESAVALENGYHLISAKAVDQAGNVGQALPLLVAVATTQNEAALTNPLPGRAVKTGSVLLKGYVHFQEQAGEGQVEVLVDGVSQGMATSADDTALATSWRKQVTLSGEGGHTITLRASRSQGTTPSVDTTATLVLDTQSPTLSFTPPAGVVTGTVTLSGTASDDTSGLISVAVSDDGGYTYEPALLSDGAWSYDWTPGANSNYASYPLRIRVEDRAGNVVVQPATVVVDNQGPGLIDLLAIRPSQGSHVAAPGSIELSWVQPRDGSGLVEIWVAVDQFTNTVPTGSEKAIGASYSATLPAAGTWYVHVSTVDALNHQVTDHFGPWYAESGGGLSAAALSGPPWQSSVQVDGYLDIHRGEWHPATELLGRDPRPRGVYALYTTWDEQYLYYGWQGPQWGPDGTGMLHFDTQPGGTASAFENPGLSLPFAADYVLVSGFDGHVVFRYINDGNWEEVDDPGFLHGHGANGDTEVRISRAALSVTGEVRLLASVQNEGGHVQSVLPSALNPLSGPWQRAYSWPDLAQGIDPNAGQPQAHHMEVRVSSPDIYGRPPGPNSQVRYVFQVTHDDPEPLERAVLLLYGSEGLLFEKLSGWPQELVQSQGDRWFIDLGEVEPGLSEPITLTARLAGELTGTDVVTVTAEVRADVEPSEPDLALRELSHGVDSRAPELGFDLPAQDATLRSGPRRVYGWASDAGGGGVAWVEVQVNGGPWQRAQGSKSWSAEVDVPAEGQEVELAARAVDRYGHVSELKPQVVTVDNVPPTASLALANPVLAGRQVRLSGSASDPYPTGGALARVELQIDDGPWLRTSLRQQGDDEGSVRWYLSWRLPEQEGVQHSLRVRAVDVADNVGSASDTTLVTVDSLSPTSGILSHGEADTIHGDHILIWGIAQDGWGVAAVDVSVDGGNSWESALLGEDAQALLAAHGVDLPPADQLPDGAVLWAMERPVTANTLALRSRATDLAGNVEPLTPPLRVHQALIRILLPLILQ